MRDALLLIAILGGINVSNASELAIKGIRPGMSLEDVKAIHPVIQCGYFSSAESDTACLVGGMVTFGGARGDMDVLMKGGKVTTVSVEVDSKDYAPVVEAIKKKYGKPTYAEMKKLQNGFGAVYISHEYTWLRSNAVLWASQYSGSVEQSSFRLSTPGDPKKHTEDRKKRADDL